MHLIIVNQPAGLRLEHCNTVNNMNSHQLRCVNVCSQVMLTSHKRQSHDLIIGCSHYVM